MCNFCLIDQKMELSKKRNPQNGRKKSAKRTQKTANKRNLKKCSNFLLMCQWFGQLLHQYVSILLKYKVAASCRYRVAAFGSCLFLAMSKESLDKGLQFLRQDTTESCDDLELQIQDSMLSCNLMHGTCKGLLHAYIFCHACCMCMYCMPGKNEVGVKAASSTFGSRVFPACFYLTSSD